MTYRMLPGRSLSRFFSGKAANGEASHMTIDAFLTLSSGFCVLERLGVIFRQATVTGRILIGGSAVGVTEVFGSDYLSRSLMSRIWNG